MPRTVNLTNTFMNRIDSELEKDVWMTQPVSYSGQRNASGGEMRDTQVWVGLRKRLRPLYTKTYFPRRLQKARGVLDYWKIRKPRLFIPVPALRRSALRYPHIMLRGARSRLINQARFRLILE